VVFTLEELDTVATRLGHEAAQEAIRSLGVFLDKHFGAIGGFSTRHGINEYVTVLPASNLTEAEGILAGFIKDFQVQEQGILDIWAAAQRRSDRGVRCAHLARRTGPGSAQPGNRVCHRACKTPAKSHFTGPVHHAGRRQMKKYAMETTVGIFVTIGILLMGYMTVKLGHVSFLGDNSYRLSAPFTSVSGLRIGSAVYALGIEIGRVEGISMDQESQKAIVSMKIRNGIKIYDDAIASIKTEGLIGDKYISIDPGGGGTLLASGGTITETQPAIDIAELIGKYAFGEVKKPNGDQKTQDNKP